MIKCKNLLITALLLSACATPQPIFDETFSRNEIASMTSDYFDLNTDAAERALKPTYQKYGAPHIYVSGLMSSLVDSNESRLHGTGVTALKLAKGEDIYWTIDGAALSGHTDPIKTAHLIYNKVELENLEAALMSVGSLSRRGQVFTIFERESDGQIIVTLRLTDDLPEASTFDEIQFSSL